MLDEYLRMAIEKGNRRPYPSLKAWRLANQLNGVGASQKLGISPAFYSKIERGVMTPGKVTGKHISDTTGVPLETVLGIA